MKKPGILKAVAAIVCLATLAVPAAAMTLTVDAGGVTVAGVPAGSRVILFGVGREPRRHQSAIRRWTEVLADVDRDGIVRFSSAVTNKSIWVAVDLETGESVAGTGPGYPRREITAGFGLKRNDTGQLSRIEDTRGMAELLIVRPGRGAWRLSASKSSAVDDARNDPAVLRIDAASFRALNAVPSDELRHLGRGDVLAMIDPRVMEFYVVRVSED